MTSPENVAKTLKRMADEDDEDIRAIAEARKRLKTRHEGRSRLFEGDNSHDEDDDDNDNDEIFNQIAAVMDNGMPKTFAGQVEEFKEINEHGEESVLWCGACLELPDDPILTSCLHLYCTECFSEMLVEAKDPVSGVVPAGLINCEAHECPGFDIADGYRQLSASQFKTLVESVGMTVLEPASPTTNQPESHFASTVGAYGGSFDPTVLDDDVAALWQSIDPRDVAVPASRSIHETRPLFSLPPPETTAARRTRAEDQLDGLFDEDDNWEMVNGILRFQKRAEPKRSVGYKTPEDDDDNSDDNLEDHPFINDSELEKAKKYLLDSDSGESSEPSSSEGEYDSDVSDVSVTEARLLKREWPDSWQVARPVRQPLSMEARIRMQVQGWNCASP